MNGDLDQMNFYVLQIGQARCAGDWNFKNVCSPFTRIYYVTEGHAQVGLPDRVLDLRPGHLYIIPAFTPHDCISNEAFCHYYIHIYNESDYNLFDHWDIPAEVEAEYPVPHIIQRLCELCPGMELLQYEPKSYDNDLTLSQSTRASQQRNLVARIESRAIIYFLLYCFLRSAKPIQRTKDERIERVLNYINAHINQKVSIDELADLACMSNDHLIRLFRKEMHMTPLNYQKKKRIEMAQLKLVTETTPIKEIAYQLGFDEQTYFNRVFKSVTGLTPMSYRKQIQPH